jgi:exoribonuclease-2
MPDERIAMLPSEISDRLCSLREGEEKLALSLMVDLGSDLEITGYRFAPSSIRVKRRLTYSEVNLLHDRDEDIHVLALIARKLMQQRLDAGAIPQPPFEIALALEPDGNVSIKKIERDSISRIIVSESMILANRLAAEFLGSCGVPAFFRSQAPPKERIEGDLNNDLFCIFRQRRQLQPLNLQTRVAAHSCLGVSAYTNMTSPLRRYMDLVAQRQIISVVSGEAPVYGEDQLKAMLMELEPAVKRANLIKNRRHRYWMLKYFKRMQGQAVQALVLEKHARSYRVVLTDAMFECNLSFLPSVQLQPGEYIQVRIDRSNPRDDVFKISLS